MARAAGTADATPIEEVVNLGPTSARWLRAAGVTTLGQLRRRDLIDLWITVRLQEPKASRLLYHAIWAAAHDRDWRTIPAGEKARFEQGLVERGLGALAARATGRSPRGR